ncbi:MAG: (2Fe-2S) ferredoxin domain-containing protein [bacterium]|nr:(2Fe-2S) ferredoxin domain-containing protein [bacterium]
MKSLEELNRIRQQAREALKVREGEQPNRIVVAMGTCGIAAGAREVMTAILEELAKRSLGDVTVTQTGCMGLCEHEPLVTVERSGQPAVTYGNITAERVRRVITQHLVNNTVVGEWVIATKR